MPIQFDLQPALAFLSGLRANNNKEWFNAHRADYEHAREQFALFLDALAAEVSKFDDLGGVQPRARIMRIYRDIRFSADKSPYRTSLAASFGPASRLPYYVHLEPFRGSMIAGGLYAPSPAQLARFRQAVDRGEAGRLKEAVQRPDFVANFGKLEGEQLKTAPREYPRDHPEIELLRYKQLLASHPVGDADVIAPEFLEEAAGACRALKPLLEALQEMAGPEEMA